MPYTTFNGWNVIPMPTTPALRQVVFRMNDSIGITQSPFTMQSQVQAWPGADWWEADCTLPPMKRAAAAAWVAWMATMRGKANVCQFGDPMGANPQGSVASGTGPRLSGNHLATATTITTTGWAVNAQGVLFPGDYLQIGWRVYMVAGVTKINADGSGGASIEIWPSLREAQPDSTLLLGFNTVGLFRLADNKREWSVSETKTFGISFKLVEAR